MGSVGLRPLADGIGVELLGLDLRQPLPASVFDDVRQAFQDHCVILIRNQQLEEAHQAAFAEGFGPLARSVNRNSGQSQTYAPSFLISNVRENGQLIGALPDGEMLFHSDQCYVAQPCKAALLYSIEIPSQGGDTIFANMYLAYETLSEDLKRVVEGRKAINIFEYNEEGGYGDAAMDLYRDIPPQSKHYAHPIIRTHPDTQRRALYVNRGMTACIEGVERSESDDILRRIFDHQERSEFQYVHHWQIGDLLMWDNRCTLHARSDFPATQRRILRRVTVLGEVPVG